MPEYIYLFSQKRSCWLIIAGSALLMGALMLFFAARGLIAADRIGYEEYALCGIVAAGMVGAYAPERRLRYGALALWFISTFEGLRLSLEQFLSPVSAVEVLSDGMPKLLPVWLISLNEFMHANILNPIASNSDRYFLPEEIAKWLLLFFTFHLVIAILTTFSQLSSFKSAR
ncbi:disulfide oxidoreductase [Raoultella planticola]|uniref:hypothetical protein n=1 Tax=Raoultella planticola TaxID=575 RepID=UPI001F160D1A|nr:hypothetical protein [Raoultella planticola]MCE9858564.1 hypothetical protein [Raoultella planticola]